MVGGFVGIGMSAAANSDQHCIHQDRPRCAVRADVSWDRAVIMGDHGCLGAMAAKARRGVSALYNSSPHFRNL